MFTESQGQKKSVLTSEGFQRKAPSWASGTPWEGKRRGWVKRGYLMWPWGSTGASGHHEGAYHGLHPTPALWDAE